MKKLLYDTFIRSIFLLSILLCQPLLGLSQTIEDVDSHKAGSNYYNYPWTYVNPPAMTPAPDGYEPFHMEHYGRHGSRWHIGSYNYDKPYELLTKAKKANKLSPLGEKVLSAVTEIRKEFKKGRDGELSDNGAMQLFVIGNRMARNFPEIFNEEASIDAKSTVVIRCIMSMQNSLKGIQNIVPNLNVKTDASEADMWFMNYNDPEAKKIKDRADKVFHKPFADKHRNKGEYFEKLFNDRTYAETYIGPDLADPLFELLVNTQSHSDQPWLVEDVFTEEEIRDQWISKNAKFFIRAGNTKMTDYKIPFTQSNLLNDILKGAERAINDTLPSANLRYGHDLVLFPLVCLMEIDNWGEEINDFDLLASKGWHDYRVIPMAGNLQIIFYRPTGKSQTAEDILVKVLLNEEEVTLPLTSVNGPYYKWTDFKNYYINKLSRKN